MMNADELVRLILLTTATLLCLISPPARGCCLPDFSSMDVSVSVNVTFPPTMPQQWNMRVFTKASIHTNFRRQNFRIDLGPLVMMKARGRPLTLIDEASFLLDKRGGVLTAYVKAHGNSNCMEVPIYGKVGKDYQCFTDTPFSSIVERDDDVTTYLLRLMRRASLRVEMDDKCRPKHMKEVVKIPRRVTLTASLKFVNRKRLLSRRKFLKPCDQPRKVSNKRIKIPSFKRMRQTLATGWFTQFARGR
ncbi:uncharacterized protein LOC135493919 isoform X2 [Lineus longissimus]|uniref:uncharacterized protein LOC135493919 isoform X2 n=1 Tax=Lineus longissimus TaxID=88925 RepID=UPI00315D4D34